MGLLLFGMLAFGFDRIVSLNFVFLFSFVYWDVFVWFLSVLPIYYELSRICLLE